MQTLGNMHRACIKIKTCLSSTLSSIDVHVSTYAKRVGPQLRRKTFIRWIFSGLQPDTQDPLL